MLTKTFSAAIQGVDAILVETEVSTSGSGQHDNIIIVGLPDAAVRESRERVRSAIIASGMVPPYGITTVNLAPADLKKVGSHFDLSIAAGLISAGGDLPKEGLKHIMLVGELALDGALRPVKGALPIAMLAKASGKRILILPLANAEEAGIVDGIQVIGVENLLEASDYLNGRTMIPVTRRDITDFYREKLDHSAVDYADIKGQEMVKRSMELAAAGGHNVLMIGPPGTGKTMIAKRLPTILPLMSLEEALETTKIHSIAGHLGPGNPLLVERPFRSPHHTISDAGLLGGQSNPQPGEVSLAHNGVLFLDELPEFKRSVLEVLRQPLESGNVTISRAAGSFTFPACFQLVAAMNPCPCGHHGNAQRQCRCTTPQIMRYRSRISGPLLDRIDIHVEVNPISEKELTSRPTGESSAVIRERVVKARKIQDERFRDSSTICNAHMGPKEIQAHCALDPQSMNILRFAISDLNLSARAYDRILRTARTLADLNAVDNIGPAQISEAIQYRALDRQLW